MRWTWIVGLVAIAGPLACGSDTSEPVDDGGTTAGGMGGQGGSGGAGGGSSCLAIWTDQIMEPDPDGPDTQIHGTSAFDGTHVWMAWSRPDGNSLFDNWLAAFTCDGELAMGPIEVTQTDDNELDPRLSISGDRLIVAWISDDQSGTDNLDIRYRIYGLDGTPITDAIELAAERDGAPVTGNALDPSLWPTDTGWTLAGAWGHDDAPVFQAFVVDLDRDGVVQGDAQDADLDPDVGQTRVAVARDDGGTHVAWQEDTTTSMVPTAWSATLGGAAEQLGDPGARPDVLPGPWYAWDGDGADIFVKPPGGNNVPLGVMGTVHDARLAMAEGQLAVLWMEIVSGIDNRVHVAHLDDTGAMGAMHSLATEQAPSVYPLDLTLVDDRHGVVVYQEGNSPDFRLKAEWFTLGE